MKPLSLLIIIFAVTLISGCEKGNDKISFEDMIIDHSCTELSSIPAEYITAAKQTLHIAYGHTSHGSQLTTGMEGLVTFKGNIYAWNNGGSNGALDLHDYAMSGDLGNPDGTYFGDKIPDDACSYDTNGDRTRDGNWATEWQNSHTERVDWYSCSSAHSRPLNANMKAYAAWWLLARLAGWDSK